ncbi:MAG: L-threonylcarbamoyladenylate synthase [bacterium]
MENTTAKTNIGNPGNSVKPHRILIVQTAFIGDVVLVEPLLAGTKSAFPGASIDVVVIPAASNLLETHPAIKELIVYDKHGSDRGLSGFAKLLTRIKKNNYDLAIVPHRSLRSALLVWLAGIPHRIGFKNSAGRFLFSETVPYLQEHEVIRGLSLLKQPGVEVAYKNPVIYTSDADEMSVAKLFTGYEDRGFSEISTNGKKESLLPPPGPPQGGNNCGIWQKNIIAIAPGSVWATKRWPEEKFQELGKRLTAENGCRIILIGGEKDHELCTRIAENIGEDCLNLAGKLNLRESVVLLKKCDVLISNDSAPTHLGVAAGCRVVTIFGATVPRFGFYPYGDKHKIIETHLDLPCRPCGIHGGQKCPIGTFKCMDSIGVEKVFSEVAAILSDKKPKEKIRNIIQGAKAQDVDIAVDCLKRNGVLLIPTETLYGLAANALSEVAVKRIYVLKRRTISSPLPLICCSTQQVAEFCQLNGMAQEIAENFWPGPLTLVLQARPKLPGHVVADDGTVAVRVPSNTFCRDIAEALQAPITATSANLSGEKPAQKIREITPSIIEGVDLAFDGGVCTTDLPSTIAKITGNDIELLRRGSISLQEIHERIGVSSVE